MAKPELPQVLQGVHDLLKPLSTEEREKIIAAVRTLLGDPTPVIEAVAGSGQQPQVTDAKGVASPSKSGMKAREYFDEKQGPKSLTKIEELAVAAAYRESVLDATSNSREDFVNVFKQAKRTFDGVHFKRDLDNAKKAGLFNKGADNVLSHYGERYIEALPDREALKTLRKTLKGKKRKSASKSAKGKKA